MNPMDPFDGTAESADLPPAKGFGTQSANRIDSGEGPAAGDGGLPWEQMARRITLQIGGHPMVRQMTVRVAANPVRLEASSSDGLTEVSVSIDERSWWLPDTRERAHILANQLAVLLYERRIDSMERESGKGGEAIDGA